MPDPAAGGPGLPALMEPDPLFGVLPDSEFEALGELGGELVNVGFVVSGGLE